MLGLNPMIVSSLEASSCLFKTGEHLGHHEYISNRVPSQWALVTSILKSSLQEPISSFSTNSYSTTTFKMKTFNIFVTLFALAIGTQAAPTEANLEKKEATFDTSHLFKRGECYTTDCNSCIQQYNMLRCSMAPYAIGGCGTGLAEARKFVNQLALQGSNKAYRCLLR